MNWRMENTGWTMSADESDRQCIRWAPLGLNCSLGMEVEATPGSVGWFFDLPWLGWFAPEKFHDPKRYARSGKVRLLLEWALQVAGLVGPA